MGTMHLQKTFVDYSRSGMMILLSVALLSCSSIAGEEETEFSADQEQFNEYWYSGQAEITRYALEQARYGEIREGDAVLIFVTEDFLTDKQVKYEFGDSQNAISALKLNFSRKFYTGIYPYSMMTSVFTPIDFGKYPTLKVTTSSQEWCGHTFTQLNNRKNKLEVQTRSYFQGEGDQDYQIQSALLEDEIWARIRLNPEGLPTGEIELVPGTQFGRIRHVPLKPQTAQATLETFEDESLSAKPLSQYSVEYKDVKRNLVIKFESDFPHQILAWEETQTSGYGAKAKLQTTRATRTHSIKSDYWSKNSLADSHLRDELGLIY
jgi:hypothetical protein